LTQNEQLKSQVESFYGKLQTSEARLENERAQLEVFQHTEKAYVNISKELNFMKEEREALA